MVACTIGLLLLVLCAFFLPRILFSSRKANADWLEEHTNVIDNLTEASLGWWILLASAVSLFAELSFIRFHSSCFHLFAYFKNVSLLSCFLGLGIGFARGRRTPLATPLVLPLIALQVIALYQLGHREDFLQLLQNPVSEQLTLGMDVAASFKSAAVAYAFLGVVFVINALAFIPMGQLISRLMSRQNNLVAYGWNLAGSVIGVLLFSAVSYIWAPPVVWMTIICVGIGVFLYKSARGLAWAGAALILMCGILTVPFSVSKYDLFSPYQILTLDVSDPLAPILETSNSAYQRIHDFRAPAVAASAQVAQWAEYYNLPYALHPRPQKVLVVGSGTGNDVAAALRGGAGSVDAVEIDPVILNIGWNLHPEKPYAYPNVRSITADARSFMRRSDEKYDLIVYGLLDSHVLLSGVSGGVRLDSYVYTVEGLKEARGRLEDEGTLCLTFCAMSPELSKKLYLMLEQAFGGVPPSVYYASGYAGGITYVAGASPGAAALDAQRYQDVTDAFAKLEAEADASTDDWPFLYMPRRVYPVRYLVMIALLLVLSWSMVSQAATVSRRNWSWPCFFLGAGFMLVETKGITELALVFSSTWHVAAIVIMAIMVMAFLANLLVIHGKKPSMRVTYTLLCLSLLVGYGITFVNTSVLSLSVQRALLIVSITTPIFFSGLAFSSELKKGLDVGGALSANILGAMLGGLMEYNSMYTGFRFLYLLAFGMYLLAAVSSFRGNYLQNGKGAVPSQ